MSFQAREFVANPIPDLSPVLPKRKVIPVTDPVPFNFLVDERGAEKAKKFEEKVLTNPVYHRINDLI